jgi:uncharacterized repeat protein (TIGR01451 family)
MGTQVVEPALKITKAMPATTTICDTIPVVITVTNSGTGSADNIKVTDTLPAGLTVDGKNAFESVIGTLAAGQSREVRFSAKAAKAGAYSNAATATADGGLKADSGNVSTTVTAPSLDIKLECPPAQLLIGRNATFKATITNTGDAPCAATASATLPAGATFVSADAGGTSAAGKVNWNLGNLAPKASKVVTFVLNSKTAGSLQTSITGNCTNCPGTAPVANCTTSFQGVPDIGTGVSDSDGVVVVGQNHTFTYSVVNQGQVNLTNVTMVGDLSDGLEFVSATSPTAPQVAGKKLTFTIGTLTPGQKVTFNIVAKGTAAGEQGISTETRSTELKRTVRNDEQVTYVAQ